jgi:pilus assembly protein FimV
MNRVWLLLLCLLGGKALAMGLGEIRLDSALNQPLRAEIVLISATPEELDNLRIELASTETFARYGIDRPLFLSRMNFQIVRSGRTDGNIVRVSSADPITEPFLTFLVEANWTRGRLLREYTLLLDPPTFAPPPSVAQQQVVEPPVRSAPADSGNIPRSPSQTAPAPSRPQPAASPSPTRPIQPASAPAPGQSVASDLPPPSFDSTPGGDYTVSRGDTLWGIASRMRPDDRLTMNQTMLAIFEANPEAFANNINVLSAGSSLRIPSADEVFRINRGDALAEVQRQNSAWGGSVPLPPPTDAQPSLTLVPPDEDTLTTPDSTAYDGIDPDVAIDDDASPTLSIEDVRIQEIEELIADQQDGLVVISDNELTALRRELAELRGEEPPADLADDEDFADEDFADDELMVDDEDAVFTDDIDDPEVVDTDVSEPEIADPVAPVIQPPAEVSLVDRALELLTDTWTLIGAALVIVAGLLVWFARRASGGDDEDATGLWETLDAPDLGSETAQSTERLRAMARDDDTSIVVVEEPSIGAGDSSMTSTMEVPQPMEATLPADDVLSTTDTNRALEDTFSSDTAINLDQSDPIAEADFHMAYGLYDQAADLINGALAVDSGRQDLMAKLCEIYFVWGNRDAFIDAAQRLQASLSGAEDPEWDKIVIMGQQIAGDHALFADASAVGATKAVDLSFEGGDEAGALDMNLGDSGTPGADDMIDLGAATQSSPAQSDESSIDFVFDDDENAGTAITEEMPAADPFAAAFETKTSEMPTFDTSLDDTAESPTIQTPAAEGTIESPTIEEQLAATTTGEIPAFGDNAATEIAGLDDAPSDATAEIDLDDLGLDLDAMQGSLNDDFSEHGDGDLSDLDDTSESMTLNVDDLAATGRNQVLSDIDATGTNEALRISESGLHDALDIDEALAATSEVPGLEGTASSRALPDEPMEEEDSDIGIDASLLDATGQTQIIPDDFAVETGTGRNIERALADDDATLLARNPLEGGELADDADTLMASLDDDEPTSAGDFDFAKTEALPKEAFTDDLADDATGEMPSLAPGSTDMDLDLDDLTAALQISAAGDTVNQVRDDETVEQPRPNAGGLDYDGEPTAAISPDEMSGDLHDARTMTEVGTKLDLARAYVDMGDPGGARGILEEVLDEGDESQQQQARQLLDSLPD